MTMVAAAALVGSGLVGVFAVQRNAGRQSSTELIMVDLGSVDQFPVGSTTAIDSLDVYVVNDVDEGVIALDWHSTHLRCKVLPREEVSDPNVTTLNPNVNFVDACHGSRFDLVGNTLAGPAPRGLSRYRVHVVDDRVLVDTSLLLPGIWGAGFTGGVMERHPIGVVDEDAVYWQNIWARVSMSLPGQQIVELGTFHDPATKISTVELTYRSLDAEFLVLSSSKEPQSISDLVEQRTFGAANWFITIYADPNDATTAVGRLVPTVGPTLQVRILAPESGDGSSPLPDAEDVADLLATVASTTAMDRHP
jgi:nitrite reductase/ring-hydroxylating ferredoxin subunit